MTNDPRNIKIAKTLGWTNIRVIQSGGVTQYSYLIGRRPDSPMPSWWAVDDLPDWYGDLNAAWDFVPWLDTTNYERWADMSPRDVAAAICEARLAVREGEGKP